MIRNEVCVLSTAYLPPIQWFAKIAAYPRVVIEAHENYVKQTYRNRCLIADDKGTLPLVVPAKHGNHTPIRQVVVSPHGNWPHIHRQALITAYENSPFFEFYADDILPLITSAPTALFDFNTSLVRKLTELLDLNTNLEFTAAYYTPDAFPADDFRNIISPKTPLTADYSFFPEPYYQAFAPRRGFIPNLSVIDLLFNMGPEARPILRRCNCRI